MISEHLFAPHVPCDSAHMHWNQLALFHQICALLPDLAAALHLGPKKVASRQVDDSRVRGLDLVTLGPFSTSGSTQDKDDDGIRGEAAWDSRNVECILRCSSSRSHGSSYNSSGRDHSSSNNGSRCNSSRGFSNSSRGLRQIKLDNWKM